MRDARRRPRDVVGQFFPIHHRETGELVGYLTDVSVDGGMLEAHEPLDSGEVYPLELALETPVEGTDRIAFDARCVWTRKERNAVFHRVGFELVSDDDTVRQQLRAVAEHFRLDP
ncbi:PilZ domain-containing protein [Arhodomonas aquaeolei]|uniref:PilZ domain-containing protein n=1 Tax=Arhodomonas aquaeolei TaxID=2369 RepID=UPI00037C6C4D|nr:PilZ domain-containing protein [Arhodomonas aquaeolei]